NIGAFDGMRGESRLDASQGSPLIGEGGRIPANSERKLDLLTRKSEEQLHLSAATKSVVGGRSQTRRGAAEMGERRSAQRSVGAIELNDAERGTERDEHGRHIRSEERVAPDHRLEAPLRLHQVNLPYKAFITIPVTVIRRTTTTRFSKF